MTNAVAPTGTEPHIRALVFKDGDKLVAQCLEYDIVAQADDMGVLMDRLNLTVEAEFAACEAEGKAACDCITPAPNYYHGLWEKRVGDLQLVTIAAPAGEYQLQYAMAA